MRKRKDYKLPPQPVSFSGPGVPCDLVVRFQDAAGAPASVLDLSAYAGRARMAANLAHAFRWYFADKSNGSRQAAKYQFVHWFRFLDEHDPRREAVLSTRDIDGLLLRTYAHWLGQQPLAKGTRAGLCSLVNSLLAWLQRNRPDLVQEGLDIPRNLHPGADRDARPRPALAQAELDGVLAACRVDIEASWADFERGQALIAQGDSAAAGPALLTDLDLKDLAVVLALIVRRHGGVIPRRPLLDADGKTCWRLHQAIRRQGGNQRISRFLHATAETLIPYMVAIGAQTFANPDALRNFGRDCMTEHVLFDGRVLVSWGKGRSNRGQRRTFLRDRDLSVPNLIDRVLALTAPLVPHSPAEDREKLFLAAGVLTWRRIGMPLDHAVVEQVHLFAERHGLRTLDGTPLVLTLASLRATGLTLAHAALGHDVTKTQVLANHAHPDTTRRYIDQPVVKAEQAVAFARLQGRFVEAMRGGDSLSRVDEAPAFLAVDARNATASGFICADPLAGVAPGQRKGRLCTAWLGCFTCPNAVIPLDADTLARLLRTRDALAEAHGIMALDRWMLLYAPKLEILERDVVPRFPVDVHVAAQARLGQVPCPPPIE